MGSFLNAPLLWGALLFTVPLIIHLLNKRRFRRVRWAAMDFLLRAYKRTQRRMRLENILLLLARCLIPVLFALAAARPFLSSAMPLGPVAGKSRDVILVIDESYSMARRAGGETCFDIAKNQVRKLLKTLDFDGGDTATIVTLSKTPRLLSNRLNRAAEHLGRLDELSAPSFDEADFSLTLRFLRDEVITRIHGSKDIFFFTDLQKRTFSGDSNTAEGEVSAQASILKSIVDQDARVVLVDAAGMLGKVDNLSVEQLAVVEKTVLTNEPATLVATVRDTGSVDHAAASATFVVDGEPQRSLQFAINHGATTTVEATHIFRTKGYHQVEVRLEEDDLDVDSVRYLSVPVRDRIPVLLVDGDPDEDPYLSETGVLAGMLNPVTTAETGTPFKPTTVSYHQFNAGRENLGDYDLIVLANVPEVAEALADQLENYVLAGHGLMIFLGDKVDPVSYNARLWKDGKGVLPYKLTTVRGGTREQTTSFVQLQVKDFDHPVLEVFKDPELRNLLLKPPILGFYGMDEVEQDGVHVVARVSDNAEHPSPAIVEKTVRDEKTAGEGRVLLYATSADSAWNAFPDLPATFLPLVQGSAYYLTVQDPRRFNQEVLSLLPSLLTPTIPRQAFVTYPGGRREPIAINNEHRQLGLFPLRLDKVDTGRPGFYALDVVMAAAGAGAEEEQLSPLYSVSVNPAEGDLTRATEDDLSRSYGNLITRVVSDIGDLVVTKKHEQSGELAQTVILLLLVLTVAELLMAWKFGRRG